MHNLASYSEDAFSLYKEAVNRKKSSDSKERLIRAEKTIQSYYKEFDSHFPNNTLRSIASRRIRKPLYDDLYDMYKFDAEVVKQVRIWLEKNNPITVYGICQSCGICQFDTMDHILPHKQYAEYSVHARNLIPCCSECNRRKNEQEILNLYTDILPNVEYLFMDVFANGDTIDFLFRLDNSKGLISANLFNKISNHYIKLDLFSRIKKQAITQLTRFVLQINNQYKQSGKIAVITSVNEEIDGLRVAYGYNYWEVAFKSGLINSPVFWDYYTRGKLV